jgi:hypothetical protein
MNVVYKISVDRLEIVSDIVHIADWFHLLLMSIS